MRVVSGTARGRKLKAPPSGITRPFTGKAKEGVFSSISERVEGASVLDLFAGSGSLAIEALSRGAASAVIIEENGQAMKVIGQNLASCDMEATMIKASLPKALARVTGSFDLAFIDPPYRLSLASVVEVLELVAPLMESDGTVVVHRRRGSGDLEAVAGLEMEDDRTYGDSHIVRYRKRGNA